MKKIVCLLVLLIFFAVTQIAFAHPPSHIIITFDASTKMLHVVIVHNVSNPLGHYIKKVDVALNGKGIIEHSIFRQDNNESQAVSYLIPDVKDGDVLSVEGYCSISGILKKETTVKIETGITP